VAVLACALLEELTLSTHAGGLSVPFAGASVNVAVL
jgi:hypothetical protein